MKHSLPYWLAGVAFILVAGAFAQFEAPAFSFACIACVVVCFFTAMIVFKETQ